MATKTRDKYEVTDGCVYCGACVSSCPVRAITMTAQGAVIDRPTCIGCGICADNCCVEVIRLAAAGDQHLERKHP